MSEQHKQPKKKLFAAIGIFIGIIAVTGAFLSPNIAKMIDPPKKSLEETTVDFASRLINAAKAKAAGQTYQPTEAPTPLPSRFIYPAIIGLGMIAAAFGATSLIRSEDRTLAGSAMALGVGAVFIQWSMMIIGGILAVIFILAIVSLLTN